VKFCIFPCMGIQMISKKFCFPARFIKLQILCNRKKENPSCVYLHYPSSFFLPGQMAWGNTTYHQYHHFTTHPTSFSFMLGNYRYSNEAENLFGLTIHVRILTKYKGSYREKLLKPQFPRRKSSKRASNCSFVHHIA